MLWVHACVCVGVLVIQIQMRLLREKARTSEDVNLWLALNTQRVWALACASVHACVRVGVVSLYTWVHVCVRVGVVSLYTWVHSINELTTEESVPPGSANTRSNTRQQPYRRSPVSSVKAAVQVHQLKITTTSFGIQKFYILCVSLMRKCLSHLPLVVC